MTSSTKFFGAALLLLAIVGALVGALFVLGGPRDTVGRYPAPAEPADRVRAAGEGSTDLAFEDERTYRSANDAFGASRLQRRRIESEWDEEDLIWVRGTVDPLTGEGGCSGPDRKVTVYALLEERNQAVLREVLYNENAPGRGAAAALGARSIFARRELDESGEFKIPFPPDVEIGHLIALGNYESMSNSSPVRLRVERSIILNTSCGGCVQGVVSSDLVEENEDLFGTEEDHVTLTVNPLAPASPIARAKYAGQRVRIEKDGSFLLRAVPPGAELQIDVHSAALAVRRVDLAPILPGETREIEVVLPAGGRIEGIVVDEAGTPVEEATVEARLKGGTFGFDTLDARSAQTDAQGRFVLDAVAPGRVYVAAEKLGWLEKASNGGDEAARGEIEVVAGETVEGVEIVLDRGAEIAGVVQLPDGSPASGAQVRVSFAISALSRMTAIHAARGGSGRAVTADDGSFRVQGLGLGPFTVTATREDPDLGAEGSVASVIFDDPTALAQVGGEADDFGPSELAERERLLWKVRIDGVKPGTRGLELVLSPPSILRGQVLLEGSTDPVTEYSVHAQRINEGLLGAVGQPHLRSSFRTEDGRFGMKGLGTGTWKITVDSAEYALSETKLVSIPRAEDAEELTFSLVRGATVSGFVRNPLGLSCPEAEVRTEGSRNATMNAIEASPRSLVARTGIDGSFRLEGLQPGSIVLEADALGYAASVPMKLELAPGEHRRSVEFELRTGGSIEGQIFDDEGNVAANRLVSLSHAKFRDSQSHRSDDEGRFRVDHLEPGMWQVSAIVKDIDLAAAARAGTRESEQTAQGEIYAALRMASVEVENGRTSEVVLGKPPGRRVHLSGRVTQGGEPLYPSTITFAPEGEGFLEGTKFGIARKDGSYETVLPNSGRYVVNVEQSLGIAGNQNSVEFFLEVPDVTEHVYDIELPSGEISGRITRHDGTPAAQARVTLQVEGAMNSASFMGGHFYESQADRDGRYSVTGLRPGSYRIAVGGMPLGGLLNDSASYGRLVRTGITMTEGQQRRDVDFVFKGERPGSVELRILDDRSEPVRDAAIFARREDGALVDPLSWALTGPDGRAVYGGLEPGRYSFSARNMHKATSLEGRSIEVSSGETVSLELKARAATRLVVATEDEAGDKIRAWYVVESESGVQVQRMQSLDEIRRSIAKGGISLLEANFGPLPPGRYRVTATGLDGRTVTKPVKLSGQDERRMTLRLR